MKLLKRIDPRTPKTALSNEDTVLNKKLEKNSKKLSIAQENLAKQSGNSALLQKRIMKLQAKESFLISMKNLKTRFMISAPEDYNEHTDILEEKRKIYTQVQHTVDELYASLEERLHNTEGVTISVASQMLGESLGTARALLNMICDELIPMAHDGVALKGYYELKRDLENTVINIQQSQKALMSSIGKESVDKSQGIVNYNMLLTPDQNDALQMECRSVKHRLSTLHALLDVSLTAYTPRVDKEGILTEEGKRLGTSIKDNLREILNAADISRSQNKHGENLHITMPFLANFDISELSLSLQREGFDIAKENIEGVLGEQLGSDVVEIRRTPVENKEDTENVANAEDVDTEEQDDDDFDTMSVISSTSAKSTAQEKEEEYIEQIVCTPFKHCTSTDNVIEVIEKLASLTLADGTPAVDMRNLCTALAQTVKREINLGQQGIFVIGKHSGAHTYYKVGERLDRPEQQPVLTSNIELIGTKGVLASHHVSYGRHNITQARDAYLLGITRAVDSFSALIQSVESGKELRAILQVEQETVQKEERTPSPSSTQSILPEVQKEKENIEMPIKVSRILQKRDISTAGDYIRGYVDKANQALEDGMSSTDIVQSLGIPHMNSMFVRFVNSDECIPYIQNNMENMLKAGLPIMLQWLFTLPENMVSQQRKEEISTTCARMLQNNIEKKSRAVYQYIQDTEQKEKNEVHYQYTTQDEFEDVKRRYQVKLQLFPAFLSLKEEQDAMLELLAIKKNVAQYAKKAPNNMLPPIRPITP